MKVLSHYHLNSRSLSSAALMRLLDLVPVCISVCFPAIHADNSSPHIQHRGGDKRCRKADCGTVIRDWDTIKIHWTWHLDVEPRKRSSARREFQPMTFSWLLLFADGRWPEINVTRASKLLWLKALMEQNGARAQMPVKRSKFADVQGSRSCVKVWRHRLN